MKHSVDLIVTDLDGTLLRTDKTISAGTQSVLHRCREKGIKIVYATGRGGSETRLIPAELFNGRVIMNGAMAYVDDKVVYSRLIPYQIARPLLIACDRYGMKTASEYGGRHYSNFVVSDMWEYITYFDVVDFSAHELDAEKLYMVVEKPEGVPFIEKNISEGLYLKVSSDNLAMVMHKDATKAKAVAELARQWGIPQSRIVSFGDDSNDLDMLEYSGIGVAMGNALDEVKSVADFICTSNDEDGLAEWISSYVDLS